MGALVKHGFFDKLKQGVAGAIGAPKIGALGSSTGYDAASQGRRLRGWKGSILGQNAITLADWLPLIERARDAVRNSPVASSALQKFVSNVIGTGISPHFTFTDPARSDDENEAVQQKIQDAWDEWVNYAHFNEQLDFYGIQTQLAGAVFETGECFARFNVDDDPNRYLTLQLLESEQVPVYYTMQAGPWPGSVIDQGLIFDENDRLLGYHIYRNQPYDISPHQVQATQFIDIRREEMFQVMRPVRPGALRGVPMMAASLSLLWDLEGYADSERLKKRMAAMFAFFIKKQSAEDSVLPTHTTPETGSSKDVADLEPGTIMDLLPGEEIVAPQPPEAGDYAQFMYVELHKFAASVGLTYEQVTGDMKGVNYSSARVALLEMRRQCEAFQRQVIIFQFCERVKRRWLKEAVLSGALDIPIDEYLQNPKMFEACKWVSDGWQFVDPDKEIQAAVASIRGGLLARSYVIRSLGLDPEELDAMTAADRKREEKLGLIYDTNPNVVLIGRETQPMSPTDVKPNAESNEEADEDDDDTSDN